MKESAMGIALAAALLSVTAAQASEFSGAWVGAKIGSNRSDVTGVDTKSATAYGLEAGYNWDMGGPVLGVDGFYDSNSKADHNPAPFSYGSNAYGLDAKLGLSAGGWLPYAKLGYARTNANGAASAISGGDVHLGLGVEYKFAPHWSLAGEYTSASAKSGVAKINNRNLTLGINYYFSTPYVAPAAVAVVAPVVVKKPEPVVVPEPAPVVVVPPPPPPAPKTIFTDKPVTIEGANFDTGSAKLKPTASKQLDEVVDFAAKYKEANLSVDGYTDSRGNEKSNLVLSAKRAEAVKAYLVGKGVDAKRIVTSGKGSAEPIGDNKTAEGRAKNRREEIDSMIRVAK